MCSHFQSSALRQISNFFEVCIVLVFISRVVALTSKFQLHVFRIQLLTRLIEVFTRFSEPHWQKLSLKFNLFFMSRFFVEALLIFMLFIRYYLYSDIITHVSFVSRMSLPFLANVFFQYSFLLPFMVIFQPAVRIVFNVKLSRNYVQKAKICWNSPH